MSTDTIMLLEMGFSMLVAVAAWMLLRMLQDQARFGVRLTEAQRKPVAAAPQPRRSGTNPRFIRVDQQQCAGAIHRQQAAHADDVSVADPDTAAWYG
jgi:ABC-type nickel/cobalt efflux system permease component RcnA